MSNKPVIHPRVLKAAEEILLSIGQIDNVNLDQLRKRIHEDQIVGIISRHTKVSEMEEALHTSEKAMQEALIFIAALILSESYDLLSKEMGEQLTKSNKLLMAALLNIQAIPDEGRKEGEG